MEIIATEVIEARVTTPHKLVITTIEAENLLDKIQIKSPKIEKAPRLHNQTKIKKKNLREN